MATHSSILARKIPWTEEPGRLLSMGSQKSWTWLSNLLLFSHQVVSDSLQPHGLQQARPSCPSLSPGVCSSSCPLSWWFYLTISSSATSFFSCLQSFPESGSLPINWLFASGVQNIGASASVFPMNIQGWFPLGLTGLISLIVQGTLKSLLQHHSSKVSILWCSAFIMVQFSHYYADKGLCRQSYGFASSPLWMWKLDHKKGWELKNWCFWSVLLARTLESPLDCMEIKPVNPKGNQPWIFIGRIDAEAEALILWPPGAKSQLIGKDPDAGKGWRWKEKRAAEDEMVR